MFTEESYRSWKDFETEERRRVGSFQLSVDNLAKDLYLETPQKEIEEEEAEITELNFDY